MMEPTSSPLSGALGYVLIGEILGVLALSWLCIGMMMRRLREESIQNEAPSPLENTLKVEDAPEYLALMEKVSQLEAEKKKLDEGTASGAGVEEMRKKITFLENKLLEYEIVQEEISTLGELKAENEKLKAELNAMRVSQTPTPAPTPTPAATEELIKKQFSEFSGASKGPNKDSMPEDIQSLLSDIESLSQEKPTKP